MLANEPLGEIENDMESERESKGTVFLVLLLLRRRRRLFSVFFTQTSIVTRINSSLRLLFRQDRREKRRERACRAKKPR